MSKCMLLHCVVHCLQHTAVHCSTAAGGMTTLSYFCCYTHFSTYRCCFFVILIRRTNNEFPSPYGQKALSRVAQTRGRADDTPNCQAYVRPAAITTSACLSLARRLFDLRARPVRVWSPGAGLSVFVPTLLLWVRALYSVGHTSCPR